MSSPTELQRKPSFSRARRWGIGFHVAFIILVVFSVVVMVNYLSHDYFHRFHLSGRGRTELSGLTVKVLQTMTNDVRVTLYYDKDEALYSMVLALLNEYRLLNSRIHVETVDYLRDPASASRIVSEYRLVSGTDRNLIIFDCEGRKKIVDGNAIANFVVEAVEDSTEREFRKRPVAFAGEKAFTAALIAVTDPQPMKAYMLQGHGEHRPDSGDDLLGYMKFAAVLQQSDIMVQSLTLLGTNPVPADCNLLVIAGPTATIPDPELEKVEQYLNRGGRLFAMLNSASVNVDTGVDRVLAKWGVVVGQTVIRDLKYSLSAGEDIVVSGFSRHPVVNPLLNSGICLVRPRPVQKVNLRVSQADLPKAEGIAFTSSNAFAMTEPSKHQMFAVAAAVEKGAIKGVAADQGTTRIIVVGDSIFLGNHEIELYDNREFAASAANWLLDRPEMLGGLGPKPIREYRLRMTRAQLTGAEWLLLAGMPCLALALGSLVWLRRRR